MMAIQETDEAVQGRIGPRAVTFGRFNITTVGHTHAFQKMVEKFGGLTVGVIDPDLWHEDPNMPKRQRKFVRLAASNHDRTSYGVQSRAEMLRLAMQDAGLDACSDIRVIGRPECGPENFNRLFPLETFTVAFGSLPGNGDVFERKRNRLLPGILGRPVETVATSLVVHCSQIATRVLAGEATWGDYVGPAAHEFHMRRIGALVAGAEIAEVSVTV